MKNYLVVITLLCLVSVSYADRTVWYVHPDSALNSIQAGLDSCANNDIVLVGPGTYYENIVWPNTQGIHLISELGPEQTFIDGDNSGSVIFCSTATDTTTMLRGFTIQNGFASGQHPLCDGGGICYVSSSLSIIGNNFINNRSTGAGGAIYGFGDSYSCISGNTITGNRAAIWGGGICFHNCAYGNISYNIINYNTADISGGAVSFIWASGGTMSYNIITYNTALSGRGGGIEGTPQLYNNTISYNSAYTEGGGIFFSMEGYSGAIENNIITHNYAHNKGGGISFNYVLDYEPLSIIRNTITNNAATYGGGLYCRECSLLLDSCTISNNIGSGVLCDTGNFLLSLEIHNSDIYGNRDYGIHNLDISNSVNAEYNWWGDSTGPYHPDSNPGGLGDTVSDYVDFIPWLYWPGVEERPTVSPVSRQNIIGATIFAGPLQLPRDKSCKVFDITGREVKPHLLAPGIYFIEIDGVVTQKVVKVR